MTSLHETLPVLSATVPEVPTQIAEVTRESDALETAAQSLIQDIEEKRAHAAALTDRVEQLLNEARQQAVEARTQLEAAVKIVEDGVDASTTQLEDAQAQVSTEVEGLETTAGALQDALTTGGDSVKRAQEGASEALDTVAEALRAGEEDVRAAIDAARGEAEGLEQAVEEFRAELKAAVAALDTRLQEHLDEGELRLKQSLDNLQQWKGTLDGHLQEEGGNLKQGKQTLLDDIRQRLEDELKQKAAVGVGEVVGALEDLTGSLDEAREASRAGRDVLQALFGTLKGSIEPFPAAIEAVKKAADELGINWG